MMLKTVAEAATGPVAFEQVVRVAEVVAKKPAVAVAAPGKSGKNLFGPGPVAKTAWNIFYSDCQ